MKIILAVVVGLILIFNYCIFKIASNISRLEEKLEKENK